MKKIFSFLVLIALVFSLSAIYIEKFPVTITQPDGTEVPCFVSGDEFYNWVHDADGYTLIRDPQTGIVVYAKLANDELISSGHKVGSINPAKLGLQPWLNISPEKRLQIRSDFKKIIPAKQTLNSSQTPRGGWNNGTLNNLVVYIRFADEEEFPKGKGEKYQGYFNRDEPNQSSMYAYFKAVSNEKTFIPSHFFPESDNGEIISYKDIFPRSYYQPYDATTNPGGYHDDQVAQREQELITRAIDFVRDEIPSDLNLDFNDDGYVDNIAFIVSGFPGAWASLLWPHMWVMFWNDVYINGKKVFIYNFLIERHLDGSGPSVLAHEMGHSLGLPDLYRYAYNGEPVGKWDLMASNTTPPQSTTAYMKMKYGGWIEDIPEITENGTYTLNNVWSETNNAYKIISPNSTEGEFFVIEYRNKNVYWDKDIPGSGLIIYRINPNHSGNAGGPPDELYIYRIGGKSNMANDGGIGGSSFSIQSGRTSFNNVSNPSCFLSSPDPNNPGGTGLPGGIAILNVGQYGGETMSFEVDFSLVNTQLHVSPNTLTFAHVPLGTTSEPQTITVSGTDLVYPVLYETTGNPKELFAIEETDNWNPTTGGTLAVRFTPQTNKIETAKLVIKSLGATSHAVTLKAQGSGVAIEEQSISDNIAIFPNPTIGEFRIEMSDMKYEILEFSLFDIFGRVMEIAYPPIKNSNPISSTIHGGSPVGEGGWSFSLGGLLPSGVYFIRIQTENSVITKKIIKL